MNHSLSVTGTIEINASIDKVWKGLTEPAIIKQFLYGTDTKTTWEPGTPIEFSGEWEGQGYRDHGVVKEFVPNKTLSYSYWSGFSGTEDKPENYSMITLNVDAISENTTRFTWIQTGYATQEGYEHSKSGMDAFMAGIKSVIENS